MDRAGVIFLGKVFVIEIICVILVVELTQLTKDWMRMNGIVDSWGLTKGSPAGLAFNLCLTVGFMVVFGVLLWNERKQSIKNGDIEKVKTEGCEHFYTLPYPHCIHGCRFIKDSKCNYREMHVPTIAVDFDRVLFTHDSWQGHLHYGDPIPGAKEALTEMRRVGFKIMIWTTRDQTDIIKLACSQHDIPYDYINENPNQPPEINKTKPVADYYIDDRALHFQSWDQTMADLKRREVHDPYYAQKKEEP